MALLIIVNVIRWCSNDDTKQNVEHTINNATTSQNKSLLHEQNQTNIPSNTKTRPLFDPNTCDSATLLCFDLSPKQVHVFMNYRRKGARFHRPEDLKRVYSLSTKDCQRMIPYVKINKVEKLFKEPENNPYRDKIDIFPIDIANADSVTLTKIPGIGAYYSSKILRYRNGLGGFVSVAQLKEITGLPETIEKYVTISDTLPFRKLNINTDEFKTLLRHPYLDYEQVKAIKSHIHKYGKLKSLDELSNYETFTEQDITRLEKYVSYN